MLVIKKPYAIEIKPFNLSQNVRKWKKHVYLVIFIMYKMNVLEKFIVQNSENPFMIVVHKTSNLCLFLLSFVLTVILSVLRTIYNF